MFSQVRDYVCVSLDAQLLENTLPQRLDVNLEVCHPKSLPRRRADLVGRPQQSGIGIEGER